jgi:creatinine amidohydrolase
MRPKRCFGHAAARNIVLSRSHSSGAKTMTETDSDLLYSVRGPKTWSTMTSHELVEQLTRTDIVMLPMGAIEQHAGHLPLGQDNFQIEEIVRRAALKLADQGRAVIIGPTVPFAPVSNLQFAGSIDIKPTTLITLVKEICLNLHRDGVNNIALCMGHDMSLGALMVAARELASETDDALKVIVANWLPLVSRMAPEIRRRIPDEVFNMVPENARDGHGGAGETARLMWQHPELVVMERHKDYRSETVPSPVPFMGPIVSGGGIYAPRKTSNRDPEFEGILGYPSIATPELGDALYDGLSDWLAGVVAVHCFGSLPGSYSY